MLSDDKKQTSTEPLCNHAPARPIVASGNDLLSEINIPLMRRLASGVKSGNGIKMFVVVL